MKSSDAKASKCRLKFSSKMSIFIRLLYLYIYIQLFHFYCIENDLYIAFQSKITEHKHRSLIQILILDENFRWHLEAFASELFIYL